MTERNMTAGRLGLPGLWSRLPVPVRDLLLFAVLAVPALVAAIAGADLSVPLVVIGSAAFVVLFRRRWPIPTVVGLAMIYLTFRELGMGQLGMAGLSQPLAVAIFTVAARYPRRTAVIVGGATAATLLLALWLLRPAELFDPRTISILAIIAAATALGDAIRSNREYLEAVTERAIRAEETRESEARRQVAEDRLRIARDLHDVVAHQIAVINLQAGVASTALGGEQGTVAQSLQTIRQAARSVLTEIGDLLAMLRAAQPEESKQPLSAVASLSRLEALVGQFADTGMTITCKTSGNLTTLTPVVDVVGYRVIQEALTNAHKHGLDGRVELEVDCRDDALEIRLQNATRGAISEPAIGYGHGLQGIQERVDSVRGTSAVTVDPAGYFGLEVRIPLSAPDPPARRHPSAQPEPLTEPRVEDTPIAMPP